MESEELFIDLDKVARNFLQHDPRSHWFKNFQSKLIYAVNEHYGKGMDRFRLGNVSLQLPFVEMGNINSSHLFGLNEVIIFSFYHEMIRRKRISALDLGANIGLHTLLLRKMGIPTLSVEPDPLHMSKLKEHLELNDIKINQGELLQKAVSISSGTAMFLRVMGNTTGSHLVGARTDKPYGPVQQFEVNTISIVELLSNQFNLLKMDVEGMEASLICSMPPDIFKKIDILLEVGSTTNASRIFDFAKSHFLGIYSQRIGWNRVMSIEDMPSHHSHGTLLISKDGPPFGLGE